MGCVAFIYDDYYCHGVKDSFAGHYDDESEACEVLRGGRFSKQNLETMDTTTLGISRFKWLPLYKYDDKQGVKTLTHRWDKDKPVITLVWDNEFRRYGHDNVLFDAGEWIDVDGPHACFLE